MFRYRTNNENQPFLTKYITLLSMESSHVALPNIEVVTSKAYTCVRVKLNDLQVVICLYCLKGTWESTYMFI